MHWPSGWLKSATGRTSGHHRVPAGNGVNPNNLGPAFDNNAFVNRLRGEALPETYRVRCKRNHPCCAGQNPFATPSSTSTTPERKQGEWGNDCFNQHAGAAGLMVGHLKGIHFRRFRRFERRQRGFYLILILANGIVTCKTLHRQRMALRASTHAKNRWQPNSGRRNTPAGTGDGFGSLLQPFGETFKAQPMLRNKMTRYQFRLKGGRRSSDSAAARGSLLTGGTAKAITNYGQDYASNEFSNVYNPQPMEFLNRYNIYNPRPKQCFQSSRAISGVGQTATGSSMPGAKRPAITGKHSDDLRTQIGQNINNCRAAKSQRLYRQRQCLRQLFPEIC